MRNELRGDFRIGRYFDIMIYICIIYRTAIDKFEILNIVLRQCLKNILHRIYIFIFTATCQHIYTNNISILNSVSKKKKKKRSAN